MEIVYHSPREESSAYFHTPSVQGKETFLFPLCVGHFFCDETYVVARRSYDSYFFMYVKKGEGYAEFSNEIVPLRQGQLLLLNCYEAHKYGSKGNLEFYWVHFDGNSAKQYYKLLTEGKKWSVFLTKREACEIEALFEELIKGISGKMLRKEIQFGKYLTDMLTLFSLGSDVSGSEKEQPKLTDTSEFACERARAYMNQNYRNNLLIPEIAEYVSLSTYYFIRRFKELFGVTPHRYLLHIRLDLAQFFLKTTNRSVKDIAISSGFQCENHFCIAFKKQLGVTPTAFRDQVE